MVRERIFLEEMPPEDSKQPTAAERKLLDSLLAKELSQFGPLKLEEKLQRPDYGNLVSHEKLFSGEFKDLKAYTYDRRWLISGYIFDNKFNQILGHKPFITVDGKRQYVEGENNRNMKVGVTNPFLSPTNSGVRYFANEALNGGHLLTMLTNAREVSEYLMSKSEKDRNHLTAVSAIMSREWDLDKSVAARKAFLSANAERILKDIYNEKHESLLPAFVRVATKNLDETPAKPGDNTKKAPFHAAQPGQQELVLIFRTMQKYEKESSSNAELIEKCERDWFYNGDNERQIQTRVTFLNNYMEEWRQQIVQHKYAERQSAPTYKPLPPAEMAVIAETVRKCRKAGDTYQSVIAQCVEAWNEENRLALKKEAPVGDAAAANLVEQLFGKFFERTSPEESSQYAAQLMSYLESMSRHQAIEKLMQTLLIRSEFVFRYEFGTGQPDEFGRRMMSPRDASYALAYALTDASPDKELAEAARNGKLNKREDYKREVERLLKRREQYYIVDEAVHRLGTESFTNMPVREIRFFREFFGYPNMLQIFKDNKRFGNNYDNAKARIVTEADMLLAYILESDKNVIEKLLTTDEYYVFHSGDNEAMTKAANRLLTLYEHFKETNWQSFTLDDLAKHKDFLKTTWMRGINADELVAKGRQDPVRNFKFNMESYTVRMNKGQKTPVPFNSFSSHGPSEAPSRLNDRLGGFEAVMAYNIQLDNWDYPVNQPTRIANRKGMLTHPAWLIAQAKNTETDPIHRGKWIREKLLAGTVPDVPITVDAVVPEDHHKTHRQRLDARTKDAYCWNCHQRMNPLGLPFEMYDDFGRFRTEESLEHPDNLLKKNPDKGAPHVDLRDIYKSLPVDPRGTLDGTGDSKLDGEVKDALDLVDRLAKSERVRQSVIRYAFRYFMGRNETLSDSKTLIDADKAYLESGGSFDAVILSLLTSDSFIYRKALEN